MTPYELRFEIFKQAMGFAEDEFHANYNLAEMWNKDKNVMDYPEFPTYEEIEALADKINNFVSSK
jgi:hypothetical protein